MALWGRGVGTDSLCVSHTGPPSLWISVSRGGEQEVTVASTPHPHALPADGHPVPSVTYHRHGQLQAQGSPADDQGQHPQQADPWGRERRSALSRLG